MPSVLKGEMTRRLLKCYPGGSAADKQPVPNELSMFTFYLNTRPAKIPKASNVLNAKAHQYVSDESGNYNVTALIMLEIISKLHEHFPLFAEAALEIIDLTLSRVHGNQLFYLELAQRLFSHFNKYHKGVLFSGHPTYARRFLNVLEQFADIASSRQPPMKRVALRALESFSQSPALATHIGQKGLPIAIQGIQVNIPRNAAFYGSQKSTAHEDDEYNLGAEAIECIQKYLDVNFIDQIISVVTSLLEWVASTGQSDWQRLFVVSLPKWVPPQSRFIVSQTAVNVIYGLPKEAVKEAIVYSGYVETLLLADESKMGLSVIDILRKLMRIQHRLIASPPSSIENSKIQELIVKLRQNIGQLVRINTYPGQTSDMISEILRRYYVNPKSTTSSDSVIPSQASTTSSRISDSELKLSGPSSPVGIIINDFRDLMEIMNNSTLPSQRKLSLDLWEGTQWLLTSTNSQLLILYVKCLHKFLEFAQSPDKPSTEQGLVVRQLSDTLSQNLAPANYVAGYYSLIGYLKFLNGLSNGTLPWIYTLLQTGVTSEDISNGPENSLTNGTISSQSKDPANTTDSSRFSVICRSSIGLASFLSVMKTSGREDSAGLVYEAINERVSKSVWLPGITYPPAMPVEDAIAGVIGQGSIVFGTEADLSISLDKLALSKEEQDAIKNPPAPVAPVTFDAELPSMKLRASTSSLHSGNRNFTAESYASVSGSQIPGIHELRRRETDHTLSAERSARTPKSDKKISLPTKRDSVATMDSDKIDVLSLISSVNRKGLPRGSLTT